MADDFDPRFDPRFQPGYAPKSSEPSSRSRPSRTPDAIVPIGDALEAEPGIASPESGSAAPESPERDRPDPNPFERTLLVIGVVLVVGGIAAAFWANSVNVVYGALANPWTWQQLLQSAAWTLSAPMVTAGLAIGVGILFRRAIDWKPPE
jgi:hypothetical protein